MKALFSATHFKQNRWDTFLHAPDLNLEIGCGHGHFLLYMAQQYPQQCFLGIDLINKLLNKMTQRIAQHHLPNVRVAKLDGILALRELFADGHLANIYIHFPDPWPRLKHQERRIMRENTLSLMLQKLRHLGCLHFVTDDPAYAATTETLWQQIPQLQRIEPPQWPIMTKYEKKWCSQEKRIYRLSVQKCASSAAEIPCYDFSDHISPMGWPSHAIKQFYKSFRPYLYQEGLLYLKYREAYLNTDKNCLLLKVTLAEPEILAHTFFVEITPQGIRIPTTSYVPRLQHRQTVLHLIERSLAYGTHATISQSSL